MDQFSPWLFLMTGKDLHQVHMIKQCESGSQKLAHFSRLSTDIETGYLRLLSPTMESNWHQDLTINLCESGMPKQEHCIKY